MKKIILLTVCISLFCLFYQKTKASQKTQTDPKETVLFVTTVEPSPTGIKHYKQSNHL